MNVTCGEILLVFQNQFKVCKCSDRKVLVRDQPVDIIGKETSVELGKFLVNETSHSNHELTYVSQELPFPFAKTPPANRDRRFLGTRMAAGGFHRTSINVHMNQHNFCSLVTE